MRVKSKGTVYLVGAGPGDAGLLTLRGAELLRRADVVLYDALVNPDLLRLAPPSAEFIARGKNMADAAGGNHRAAHRPGARGQMRRAAQGRRSLHFRARRRGSRGAGGGKNSVLKSCPAFRPSWPRRITPAFRSRIASIAPASPSSPATKIRRTRTRLCATSKSPKSPAPRSCSWAPRSWPTGRNRSSSTACRRKRPWP